MPDLGNIGADWISLRDILRLLLLSALLVLIGRNLFGENATTKRIYWLCCGALVAALPWALGGATLPIALANPPQWPIDGSPPAASVYVWWAVAALLGTRVGWQISAGRAQLQALNPATHRRAQRLLAQLSDELSLTNPPTLKVGAGPCSSTVGHAVIALPADHGAWSETTLRAVLSHELVHVARRDDRWMLALRLLACWYWWIPWIHSLHQQFVRAMEESCDDHAARLFEDKSAYVDGVAEVASKLANDQGSIWARLQGHHVVVRIARFLGLRPQELDVPALYWTLLWVAGGVLLITSMQPVPLQAALPRQSHPVSMVSAVPTHWPAGPRVSVHEVGAGTHQLLADPTPIYPGHAIEEKTGGQVTVSFVVTADGHTSRSRIVSSSPPEVFDGAVLTAVRRLRYEPTHLRRERPLNFDRGKDPPDDLSGTQIVRRYQFSIN